MGKTVTFQLLREVSNDDQAFIRRMIDTFIRQLNEDLPKFKEAFKQKDTEFLTKICHRLKSSLNYMDMMEERDLCAFLVSALRAGHFPNQELLQLIEKLEKGKSRLTEVLKQDTI